MLAAGPILAGVAREAVLATGCLLCRPASLQTVHDIILALKRQQFSYKAPLWRLAPFTYWTHAISAVAAPQNSRRFGRIGNG